MYLTVREVATKLKCATSLVGLNCQYGIIPGAVKVPLFKPEEKYTKGPFYYRIPEASLAEIEAGRVKLRNAYSLIAKPKKDEALRRARDAQAPQDNVRLDVLNRLVVSLSDQLERMGRRVHKLEESMAYYEARYGTMTVAGQAGG